MNFILKGFSFIAVFLFYSDVAFCIDPDSIGKSVDETVSYKIRKSPTTISDRSYDVFTALKRISKNKNHTKINALKLSSKEVFTLRTVNGEDITNVDVLNVIKLMFLFSGKEYDAAIAKLMVPAVLEALEDDRLRQQCAAMFRIPITDRDIEKKVSDIAQDNGSSVEELSKSLNAAGISMNTFKKHIKSKMIFQMITEYFAEKKDISADELSETKSEEISKLNSERYCIAEIFRYTEDGAKQILDLIKKGFNFQVLEQNFSQNAYFGKNEFAKWVRVDSLEPEVVSVVKHLHPGECSEVIKTKAGYKIVLLIDKAKPGKLGTSDAKYKILQTSIKYKDKLFTQRDIEKSEENIKHLLEISRPDDFKSFCKENNIKCEEKEINSPDPYYTELIGRSRSSGKAAALQSQEDENYVNAVILLSEETPVAKLPTDKELKEIATEKKLTKEFMRNFKKIKYSAHIDKSLENDGIKRMFQ